MAEQNSSNQLTLVGNELPSPLEQAAIVLLCMGEEHAAAVLRCLSRDDLLEVTQVMSRISGIKVEAVKISMQKFFDDYREQSGVQGASRSYLKRSLGLALGDSIANSVLNNIYGDAIRPKMARLQWASPKWVAEFISNEHVSMQATFMVFLPPAMASKVLEALPLENRDLVLLNVAQMEEVDRDLLIELEHLVDRCLSGFDMQNTSVEGTRQAAEILNRMSGDRRQLIELLRAQDSRVASEIELSMYDFVLLSRQSEATLLRIIEEVPFELWGLALKGAEQSVRGAIMQAMPRRQAQNLEDIMRRSGPVPMSRIEQARQEIIGRIKALADNGEVEIQLFDEAVVE